MKKNNISQVFLMTFGACMIIGMLIDSVFSGFEFHIGYQFLLVSIICTALRYLFYSEEIFKGKSYTFRNAGFFSTFLPFMLALAYVCEWMPNGIGPLITFVIIFFIIGGSISVFYHIKMKNEGFKYAKSLEEYKARYK